MKKIGEHFAKELQKAGLAGLRFSWSASGEIMLDPSLTEAQRAGILKVYEAHDPDTDSTVTYADRRREEYNRRGVTMEAIMEGVIEYLGNRPQKLQALMQIRDEVRAEIPKDVP